jgi:phosphoribosylformylglycinamidine synthase
MAQLSQAIDGIAEACTALGTPVTGGNVSLYNETKGEGIYPTPVLGVVGIIEDVTRAVPSSFQDVGDQILLLVDVNDKYNERGKNFAATFGSSEYAKTILGAMWGAPPPIDLKSEARLHRTLAALARQGRISSATDISDGGLLIALIRAALQSGLGFELYPRRWTPILLFNELPGVIITAKGSAESDINNCTEGMDDYEVHTIGRVRSGSIALTIQEPPPLPGLVGPLKDFEWPLEEFSSAWSDSLASLLTDEVVTA